MMYSYLGYDTHVRGGTGDGGVDVEAYKDGTYTIIQCKRYNGNVGASVVRDLAGARVAENADKAILATTGQLSRQARQTAKATDIKIIDTYDILAILKDIKRTRQGKKPRPKLITYFSHPHQRARALRRFERVGIPLIQALIAFILLIYLITQVMPPLL